MIFNTTNGNELAQVGWLKLHNWDPTETTVYFFYEYGESSYLYPPVQLSADTQANNFGTSEDFNVYITNPNGNGTEFRINNQWEGAAYLNWTPNNAEWLGETHSVDDQMPGDTNHQLVFYGVRHLYNTVWYSENTASDYHENNFPYGGHAYYNTDYFKIWDTRYNSPPCCLAKRR